MSDYRSGPPDDAAWNQPDAPRSDWHQQPPPQPGAQPPPPSSGPPGPSGGQWGGGSGPAMGSWTPPPSGQPGPAGQPGQFQPAATRPTNGLAIAALVCSFICGPAGLIMGFMARQQIRERNEGGDGLALAAIIIGAISLLGSVFLFCLVASGGSGTTY